MKNNNTEWLAGANDKPVSFVCLPVLQKHHSASKALGMAGDHISHTGGTTMNSFNRIYTQCDICGRDIHYGNAVLEIERTVEQHDHEEETGLQTVTVIDADPLATLCASCGNSMADRKAFWELLVRELELPGPASEDDAAQPTETGLPETCDACGMELTVGRARVALVRLIGQMNWDDERNDGELAVIDGEDMLSFCPSCGNTMSSHRLRQALHRLIDDLGVPEQLEAGVGEELAELRETVVVDL